MHRHGSNGRTSRTRNTPQRRRAACKIEKEGRWEGLSQLGRDREIRLATAAGRRQAQKAILDDLTNATDTIRKAAHDGGDDDTGACLKRAIVEMLMAQATISRAIREAQ